MRELVVSVVFSVVCLTTTLFRVFRFVAVFDVVALVCVAEVDDAVVRLPPVDAFIPAFHLGRVIEAFPFTCQLLVLVDEPVTFMTSVEEDKFSVCREVSVSSIVSRSNWVRWRLRTDSESVSLGAKATDADKAPRDVC